MGIPSGKKTATGQYSTSEDVLQQLAGQYPLPALILDFRSLSKLKSTYVDALPRQVLASDQRVHSSFNQAVVATGRLASSNPNLQNIPIRTEKGREIRKAFIAEDGFKLLSADYSQIELRVIAAISGDENMKDAFLRDEDIHAATARAIFGLGAEYVVDFLPKVKIEVAISDDLLDQTLEAITKAANTGKIGDGKIFVSDLLQVIRIRTGETGEAAV
jgi:DNA polymerase-1